MVTVETADFQAPIIDGGVSALESPGLGIIVNRSVLGVPLASWDS